MRHRRDRTGRRGNAIIEFALTFTFLFPIFVGTFQFGYTFFLYNRLVNAVRAGARYASLETYTSGTATLPSTFQSAVQNVVVYGDPAGGTNPVVTGLTPANVEVTAIFVNQIPQSMKVRLTNYQLNAIFDHFPLQTPLAVFPYIGRYSPP